MFTYIYHAINKCPLLRLKFGILFVTDVPLVPCLLCPFIRPKGVKYVECSKSIYVHTYVRIFVFKNSYLADREYLHAYVCMHVCKYIVLDCDIQRTLFSFL